jgi:hypothetical protein
MKNVCIFSLSNITKQKSELNPKHFIHNNDDDHMPFRKKSSSSYDDDDHMPLLEKKSSVITGA